jgi:hypothetical protein
LNDDIAGDQDAGELTAVVTDVHPMHDEFL